MLKYKPFFPDSANLPPELKAKVPEINMLFDQVYRHVEEYERIKDSLKPEDVLKMLVQIIDEHGNALNPAYRAFDYKNIPTVIMNSILKQDQEFSRWFSAAEMEARARNKQWETAGSFAESYKNWQMHAWMDQQLARPDVKAVHTSDFNRATGYEDYNRALYYYRQQGGMNGLMNTLSLFSRRKYDEFINLFIPGRTKNDTRVKYIIRVKQ